jgi:general bacterial porin, GBP family
MKKRILLVAALSSCAGVAHAQSSVTLYGLLDAGINYINNDGGKSNFTMTTGVLQGNRWGLKGVEDLGGGLKAIFQLENGFSLATGSLQQGGREFGRQAWVGVSHDRFGSLTFGRQYDSVVDYVQVMSGIPYTGLAHPFDNDNFDNDFRIGNSVKYASPDFNGLKFGGLYGFSNSANTGAENSGFASNRSWSLGASYAASSVNLAVGYLHLNSPNSNTVGAISGDYINVTRTSALGTSGLPSAVTKEDVIAAGGAYSFNGGRVAFVYSHSKFDSATDRLSFDNYEVNANYFLTPALSLAGIYSFTDGKLHSTDANPKYHQFQLIADYFLSKRTDVYLLGAWQRAAGDAPVASIAPDTFGTGGTAAPDASTTKNQVLVRIAMRHKF